MSIPAYVSVPTEPTGTLLRSMAMRFTHDFALLPTERQEAIIRTMKQVHEEVVGTGFYHAKCDGNHGLALRCADRNCWHAPDRDNE